jgi:putative ABC transport system permease protein
MTIGKGLRQAMRSMGRSRLRTVFMTLGVMIGIASITVLMSFGESARQETMRRFKNMVGTFDTVIVRPGGGRSRGMPTLTTVLPSLTFEDAAAIETEVDGVIRVARVQNAFDIDVTFRGWRPRPSSVSPRTGCSCATTRWRKDRS